MARPIGYYVHHHGDGHRQRALAIASYDAARFTILGTGLAGRANGLKTVDLPDDRLPNDAFTGDDGAASRPQALHYAPLGHEGVRARSAQIADWIASQRPSLIVVDVSAEVAMLARLCATAVAYVRLAGRREDPPHLEAFRGADFLIAPFAPALDREDLPDWIRRKTIYASGIVPRRVGGVPQEKRILVVNGRGGHSLSESNIVGAARAVPDYSWRVIGMSGPSLHLPPNLSFAGWSDTPEVEITQSAIVIGGAGDGLVSAVLAAQRPFICIPEARPFDEQTEKAAALEREGAAVVLRAWPPETEWKSVLNTAHGLDLGRQAALDDPEGAARLARHLLAFNQ